MLEFFKNIFNKPFPTNYEKQLKESVTTQQNENFFQSSENNIINSIPKAYSRIINGDREYIKCFGKALSKTISEMSGKQIIKLSESFREHTSVCWNYDWKNFNVETIKNYTECEQDYISIIAAGTFHPNGYYRQQCLEKLAFYDGNEEYIILRLNDWIENIRKCAEKLIIQKINSCSADKFIYLSPYIYKLKYCGRRNINIINKILSVYYEKTNSCDDINLYRIKKYDLETRKSIYIILCQKNVLSAEKMELLINMEKNNFCQSYLITHFFNLYSPDMKKTDEFLNHKSAYVRYTALQYKYNKIQNIWDGFEKFLLDKRKSIREFTAYYLRKHSDFDILQFYRENLNSENPVPAIAGLGEMGIKSDVELIIPFLKSDNSRIICAVISALSRLSQSESSEIYWKYLSDNRINVLKSAYMAVLKCKITYGCETLYNEIINSDEIRKKYLINILCFNEDSWERLPFLLCLADFRKKHYKSTEYNIVHAICNRNIYKNISPALADKIRNSIQLNREKLSNEIIWGIEKDLQYMCK